METTKKEGRGRPHQQFEKFIEKQLESIGLNSSTIQRLTTPEKMRKWEIAFTHKSIQVNANENYEAYEALGDATIDDIIIQYLFKKMGVINTGFLSKMRTMVVKKRGLAQVSHDLGFPQFIKYSSEIRAKLADLYPEELNDNDVYLSIIEDVLEAFTGVMMDIVDDESGLYAGPGYAVATKWWENILDNLRNKGILVAEYSKVWDAVSRLKEIYDKRTKDLGWTMGKGKGMKIYDFKQPYRGKERTFYKVTFIAWPRGDKRAIPQNAVVVGEAIDRAIDRAKETAAQIALTTLENYDISDTPKFPFVRTQK